MQETGETIRLLVDAISNSLSRLVVRYETIKDSQARIEALIAERLGNYEVFKADVDRIEADSKVVGDGLRQLSADMEMLREHVASNTATLSEVRAKVTTTSKLSELLRKPLVIVLLILAVLIAFAELKDGWEKLREVLPTNAPAPGKQP